MGDKVEEYNTLLREYAGEYTEKEKALGLEVEISMHCFSFVVLHFPSPLTCYPTLTAFEHPRPGIGEKTWFGNFCGSVHWQAERGGGCR